MLPNYPREPCPAVHAHTPKPTCCTTPPANSRPNNIPQTLLSRACAQVSTTCWTPNTHNRGCAHTAGALDAVKLDPSRTHSTIVRHRLSLLLPDLLRAAVCMMCASQALQAAKLRNTSYVLQLAAIAAAVLPLLAASAGIAAAWCVLCCCIAAAPQLMLNMSSRATAGQDRQQWNQQEDRNSSSQ